MSGYTGIDTQSVWDWRVAPVGRDEFISDLLTIEEKQDQRAAGLGLAPRREKMTIEQKREYAKLYARQYRKTDRCKQVKSAYLERKRMAYALKRALNPPAPKPLLATYRGMNTEQTEARRKRNAEWMRMRRAGLRVNRYVPKRTQSDEDRTRQIQAASNWNRTA